MRFFPIHRTEIFQGVSSASRKQITRVLGFRPFLSDASRFTRAERVHLRRAGGELLTNEVHTQGLGAVLRFEPGSGVLEADGQLLSVPKRLKMTGSAVEEIIRKDLLGGQVYEIAVFFWQDPLLVVSKAGLAR